MKKQLIAFYLDYVNNFITITKMAEYYGLTIADCGQLVELGKKYHESNVENYIIY